MSLGLIRIKVLTFVMNLNSIMKISSSSV